MTLQEFYKSKAWEAFRMVVISNRTNQFHSVAIVKKRNAKWFVPAEEYEDE